MSTEDIRRAWENPVLMAYTRQEIYAEMSKAHATRDAFRQLADSLLDQYDKAKAGEQDMYELMDNLLLIVGQAVDMAELQATYEEICAIEDAANADADAAPGDAGELLLPGGAL